MQTIDASNTLFTLASELVNHTARDIFVTGKAGSGKTTFLKFIREHCPKQMAVVAPTGVAAINAGGVTIHSFFQLPLAPFLPQVNPFNGRAGEVSDRHSLLARIRLNSERRKVLQELELLIIDEISMVRCDVLDAIDVVLRHVRHRHRERFGGVQVLLVGDLFQLPPVVKEQEWQFLREHYESPFFFDSHVMKEHPPVCVEFTKIYRQTEDQFISLLNKVRNNEMDEDGLEALHQRYRPQFFGHSSEGYILLTTHNEKAKEINTRELERLPGKTLTYKAGVDGDFPSTAYPAEELLQLKIGAQVMFIRNDMDKARRFFNGKIGVVSGFSDDKIQVQCNDGAPAVEVAKETWRNVRYSLDQNTRQLDEDVLGTFSQYPLRLAWAITIHKSQGLTFEKAVIDAGRAFAPGQVYVALSRCTSLDGLVLHSYIQPQSLRTDERIVQFTRNMASAEALHEELASARKKYQQKCAAALFDFRRQNALCAEMSKYLQEHSTSFNEGALNWLSALADAVGVLHSTGEKFRAQLTSLFSMEEKATENNELVKRINAAAGWFSQEIKKVAATILQCPVKTDSVTHAKAFNGSLKEAFVQFSFHLFMMQGLSGQFDVDDYHCRKKRFVVPPFDVNAYAGASHETVELEHQRLYEELRNLRDTICNEKQLPIYLVAGSRSLQEMAKYLPQNIEELQKLSGFGKAKAARFGPQFIRVIEDYCRQHQLASNVSAKKEKRTRGEKLLGKLDTKAESFRLFNEGKTVTDIAAERKLTEQTIEGHLSHYVRKGLLNINILVPADKLTQILEISKDFDGGSLVTVKQKLDDSVSFGEIRLALAWQEYRRSSAHVNH